MMTHKHPPLKRHESLQPLSRDHYAGLVQAQHLVRAADAGPVERRAALADFLEAWRREIEPHFEDEERLLPTLLTDDELASLHDEHQKLRTLAEQGSQRRRRVDPGADWCRQLGEALRDHIRWEERTLFADVQARATDAQLAELTRHTADLDEQRGRSFDRGET
ncbi:MAG: hemerythrin domain-containing protein [Phycisphaeraceae bacterium]